MRRASLVVLVAVLASELAMAAPQGRGKGRGGDMDDNRQVWQNQNDSGLPPGLAKRNGDLPPGLEKHVDRNGQLPPGLEKKSNNGPLLRQRYVDPVRERQERIWRQSEFQRREEAREHREQAQANGWSQAQEQRRIQRQRQELQREKLKTARQRQRATQQAALTHKIKH